MISNRTVPVTDTTHCQDYRVRMAEDNEGFVADNVNNSRDEIDRKTNPTIQLRRNSSSQSLDEETDPSHVHFSDIPLDSDGEENDIPMLQRTKSQRAKGSVTTQKKLGPLGRKRLRSRLSSTR